MGKQTMGTPVHSFPYRMDSKLYRLQVCTCVRVRVFVCACVCACVLKGGERFPQCKLVIILQWIVLNMQTPQAPLVRPSAYDHYGIDEYPLGTNAIVAVISYTASGN